MNQENYESWVEVFLSLAFIFWLLSVFFPVLFPIVGILGSIAMLPLGIAVIIGAIGIPILIIKQATWDQITKVPEMKGIKLGSIQANYYESTAHKVCIIVVLFYLILTFLLVKYGAVFMNRPGEEITFGEVSIFAIVLVVPYYTSKFAFKAMLSIILDKARLNELEIKMLIKHRKSKEK